jgi:hypothetical protein
LRARLRVEELESRTLLSVAYGPDQVRHAYGFDKLSYDGSGQTIAIVDAYHDPSIFGDLDAFDQRYTSVFGSSPAPASSFLTQVDQNGVPSSDLAHFKVPVNAGWSTEIALDVEWAHAVAPGANILLVEAASATDTDLLAAVDYASAHASVVSMSWGGGEFSAETSAAYEGHFTRPGVTFVAASGDSGAPATWPAVSPNVLGVGGTTLTLTSSPSPNTWSSEKGWGTGSWSFFFGGSGGGLSRYESQPTYQKGVVTQSTTRRASPDVAYDADPNSGFWIYDTTGGRGWGVVGGTSAGSPQWAALVALADQGRALQTQPSLSGSGQTLPALYKLAQSSYATYFHDVTSGSNGYSAKAGYDLVTGLGTPKADALVPALVKVTGSGATLSLNAAVAAAATTTTKAVRPQAVAPAPEPSGDPSTGAAGTAPADPGTPASGGTTASSPAGPRGALAGASGAAHVPPVALSVPDQQAVRVAPPAGAGAAAPAVALPATAPVLPAPASGASYPDGGGGDGADAIGDGQDAADQPGPSVPPTAPDAAPDTSPATPTDAPGDAAPEAVPGPDACDACFSDAAWLAAPAASGAESLSTWAEGHGTTVGALAAVAVTVGLKGSWGDRRPGAEAEARRRRRPLC